MHQPIFVHLADAKTTVNLATVTVIRYDAQDYDGNAIVRVETQCSDGVILRTASDIGTLKRAVTEFVWTPRIAEKVQP